MDTSTIERIAAHSVPNRLPIDGNEFLEQRNWIIRLGVDMPREWSTSRASMDLSREAVLAVHEAHAARGLPVHVKGEHAPSVQVTALDERHIIVSIVTVRLEHDDAHSWLVAACAALASVDKMLLIDDIQGFPRRFWRLILGG